MHILIYLKANKNTFYNKENKKSKVRTKLEVS
jgi:hypothetical protein